MEGGETVSGYCSRHQYHDPACKLCAIGADMMGPTEKLRIVETQYSNAIGLLKNLQWIGRDNGALRCYICGNLRRDGHKGTCALDRSIRGER